MCGLRACILAALALPLGAAPGSWNVARSPNFEVWSDAPPEVPRTLAAGLERLRTFFVRQIGIVPAGTVRVVCFASRAAFDDYRIQPGAAGYSLTGPGGAYIVLHAAAPGDLRVPAHEYGHLVIYSSAWKLPDWLAEGLSELVSTVRFGARYSFIGGDIPGRSQPLKTAPWMPPAQLFATTSAIAADPSRGPLYYAESWAVAETLIVSPDYAPRFPAFLALLSQGLDAGTAIEGAYHVSAAALFAQVRERVLRGLPFLPLPPVADAAAAGVTPASAFEAGLTLAALRYAAGQTDRALAQYRELAAEDPRDPRVPAELGLLALERKDAPEALRQWDRALALGVRDPVLCYRFAILADERGLAPSAVRAALERALALQPDHDGALFRLGLMDVNEDRPAGALAHFRAMRQPPADRAWHYYEALASTYLELNRRDEARQAALQAEHAAATDEERKRARDLQYLAATRLTVEIAHTPDGQRFFRTARVPVDAAPRNPFIEAGDDARSAGARLHEVVCGDDGSIRLLLRTSGGSLSLTIPDPSRVQIRNGGGVKFEFVCGPQNDRPVLVEYTAAGILRGLELH